jgi:hypothetical protein
VGIRIEWSERHGAEAGTRVGVIPSLTPQEWQERCHRFLTVKVRKAKPEPFRPTLSP